jgi:RNA polymerase sigma factor (sigma-70 family)
MNSDSSGLDSRSSEVGDAEDRKPVRISEPHARRVAALFESEHDKVVHYMVAQTRSWPEARDVVAQAFKQLLELDPPAVSHLRAYVYKVARNIAANRAKARAIHQRLDKVAVHELPRTSPSPEPDLLEQQQVQHEEQRLLRLRWAIDRLPPRCRMAVELRMWDNLSYAEILGQFAMKGVIVNERTVRRWIVYAFEFCRQEILRAEESLEEKSL